MVVLVVTWHLQQLSNLDQFVVSTGHMKRRLTCKQTNVTARVVDYYFNQSMEEGCRGMRRGMEALHYRVVDLSSRDGYTHP